MIDVGSAEETLDLFQKCRSFTRAREMMEAGRYAYFIPIQEANDTEVAIEGRRVLMFGSNNYLGLTHHPKVLEAGEQAARRFGTGCTGSRFLNGTLDLHLTLEADLAALTGHESALAFSTGYQTNLGVLSALVDQDDAVFIDKLDHASLVDGGMLARGRMVRYRHNDVDHLESHLCKSDHSGGSMIAVDGVFSMEGNIAAIPKLLLVARQYGARLFVDEAHSVGVLGETGAGTMEHFGLKGQADLLMGTFSKSFACMGGFVAGDEYVIHFLKHHARSMMFSASMPPYAVATVAACLDIIHDEPERRTWLMDNARYLRDGLRALGFETGPTETPIVPIILGSADKTLQFWRMAFDRGVFTNAALPPAVAPHACRLRTSVIATHTREQLDRALDVFATVRRELDRAAIGGPGALPSRATAPPVPTR